MTPTSVRRFFVLALLAFGSLSFAACGDSSLLAPDCADPAQCEYLPDAGGADVAPHLPGSGN